RVPSSLKRKRTSRVGPSRVSKKGTLLVAPLWWAIAKDGFTAGDVPPSAGWEWQAVHWSELKRPPSPAELVVSGGDPGGMGGPGATSLHVSQVASSSLARKAPSVKSFSSLAVSPGSGPPAPGEPPRGPGS